MRHAFHKELPLNNPAKTYPLFVAQSWLLWGSLPILNMFLPLYLATIGMSNGQIGVLTALSPAMAVLLPPFIGMAADRSPSKNRVLFLQTAGAAVTVLLYTLGHDFWYLFAVGLVLACFLAAQSPLSEAILLEGLVPLKKPYGPVRLAGTFGFTVSALAVGPLLNIDVRLLFVVVGALAVANLFTVWKLPPVKGHQSEGGRVPLTHLFHDRLLTLLLGFALVTNLSLQFYNAYFAVYFLSLGGTKDQVGLLLALMSASELPFLLWAEQIIGKLGLRWTLAASVGFVALRFVIMALMGAPEWMYPLALLNGLTYIVFAYSLATYVAKNVRKELRATGQTVLGVAAALGRTAGSLGGGFLAQAIGLKATFVALAVLNVAATVVFLWLSRGQVSATPSASSAGGP